MSQIFPTSIAGFTPIQIKYSSDSTHILYVRAHTGSKKGKSKDILFPEGRTLFLVNVPPDATEREITVLFKQSGTVEKVVFDGDEEEVHEIGEDSDEEMEDEEESGEEQDDVEEQPRKKRKMSKDSKPAIPHVTPLPARNTRTLRRTGRSAHVIFLDASSLSRALSPPSKPKSWPLDASTAVGLSHYTALYEALRPPLDLVKAHADSWMDLFEYEQAKKKRQSKYKKGEAIVDDDGFTLVTRGGAYGQTLGGGVTVASKKFQESRKTSQRYRKDKKEPKEKETFYAFQVHEKKRKELIDLKRKWEEDKAKVEKLKESRKFRPY
ncbi:hypothetical protein PHLCEN_2v6572 [Hermanssonia centrifuga]|uniref:Ribosomal RNA-processing protein 7 n=1 Tax=Hermanssonia centrifuga TaxID=98765 RepID=A0A2R6NZ09_9APHY|nr:hypothetical protein PHLCEN_2v6572 [Hermanssonia centrifuga]